MDLYIETNTHPSILFSPPTHYKGTFATFPQGYLLRPPSLSKFRKIPTSCLFHPLLQLSIKRVLHKKNLESYDHK